MTSDSEAVIQARRLMALRQIQSALGRSRLPTFRACGLTEAEAQFVANEQLVVLQIVEDDGEFLDKFRVRAISERGLGVLNRGDVVEPAPTPVDIVPRQESWPSRIFLKTRSGSWDLIKIAFGAILGAYVTWYLTHHAK